MADVFAALTSPRHYRRNKLPYVAMEQIVRSAAAGQFDKPAARALVQAAGLFPVGSFVRLSSNRIARIVAANPNISTGRWSNCSTPRAARSARPSTCPAFAPPR